METIKTLSTNILGVAILIGIVLLVATFINGMVWLSDKVYPLTVAAGFYTGLACVVVMLPLAIFRRTRSFPGFGFFTASYVFGFGLWVWSIILTYMLWGTLGLIIGLVGAGVGVVPLAVMATAFHGEWSVCGQVIVLAVVVYGVRWLGIFLVSKGAVDEDLTIDV